MNADDMNPKDTQKTHVTDASKPPVKPGALARFVLELVESKCTPETITDDQRTALLSESSAEMQGDFELLSITAWALAKQDATVAALAIPDILWGVLSIQPLPGWSIHWWQPFLLLDAVLTRNIDGILAALDVPSGGTNSQQEALRARIVALRSAIPRVKELFGSQHADAVLYILTPSFLPNQELRLISNNLWLLTEETVTRLETLAAETGPALDELIAPAIDRLTSLPPLNPRIQEAAMQGRMVLARLRERVITRVKELGPQDINTVLQALEQEPPLIHSEEVGGLLYVFVKEEQTTLEEVALTWLVWQQAMAAGMNSVQIAHSGWRLVDALSPWSEHPPVAERLLTVIDSALQHAHVLTDKILGLLHLEAADCFQVRFHHEGVPECWSAWFKHAEQAMEYARTGKDSVLFANARDTYVRARSEGHPPAHGLKNALTFLRDAIATDLQVEPFVTARAHFRLAHLLLNKNDSRVSEAELSESLYALRAAAKALAGSGDWPATRHGIASQLGSAEMLAHERGDREALGRAISALESALDIWTQQYIPPSLGNSIHLYLQALKQAGRSIDLRLHWVENALDRLPASSPPEVRAVLLLELAGLHKEQGLGPKPLHEWYGAAARDLDEAEGLIRSSSSLQKAELLVQLAEHHWRLHRHAERLDEGIAVLKRLLKGSDFASRPDLETTLRSQLLSLYFQRREGLDIRKAREELVAVLQHLGRSNCRVAVLDATEKALWFGSAQNPELDLMPMAKQLEEVIAHCEGASRMRLELIFDIWRSARTGQPSLDKVADRLVDMLEQCPQDEKWDWCNPGLTWLRQHLGNRDFRVRRVAHVMEALIFDTIPHLPATTSIRNLLRLAQLRTETGDLSLEQVSRGIRLLEAAEQLLREQPHCPAEMHLEVRRWSLDARTQRLGLTPGRPVEHVLREAEKLEAEARALPEPHSSTALELLPAMLYIVDTYEREKLKTAARALVRRLQAEGRTVPDFLTQHLKQDDARASTQRAQAEHAVPVCSEQDPCAQPADAESATRQFHKYLDEAWRIIQDGQYQPLQAFPKARALLEQARHLLDPSAIASELEWAHELGHLCWQWHPYAPDDGHRALGIQVLTGVLARPESAAHPSGRAALLRLLALLEPLGDSPLVMLPALNPEPLQRGIALLEEARTLAPTSAPALRFQILVTLGNLQRRLFEFSFGKRPALLECAIQAYEDANKIWEAAREARAWVPPNQGSYFLCLQRQLNKLDRGRLQKVRADALLLTNDPTRLEDARKLARSSAKMRRMGGDGLHAAESLLTLANIEAARLNAGHQDGLRGALDAIQEARGLITLEAAGPINAQLEALRLRLEQRASPGPTPPPQDPRRVEEAARERMKLLLKMMKKSGLEPPETMDEPLQFFEAQLRGEYARSPLAPHRRCMDDAIFHLKSRLNKTPSEAQALASELSRLETEARHGSDKRVAIDHTAFLMQLQVREGTLELENRAIALAERLLDAPCRPRLSGTSSACWPTKRRVYSFVINPD